MNRLVLFCAVGVIIVTSVMTGCSKKSDDVSALSVRGYRTNSAAYQGTVTIAGAVAMVSQKDPKMFAVVDLDDVRNNVPLPQRLFLPVRYDGAIPPVGEVVNITGSFTEGVTYFTATTVKVHK